MDATTDIDVEVAPQSEKEKKMDKIFSPVVVMGGSWGSRSGTILPSATSSAPWVMLSTPLSLAAWAARGYAPSVGGPHGVGEERLDPNLDASAAKHHGFFN